MGTENKSQWNQEREIENTKREGTQLIKILFRRREKRR